MNQVISLDRWKKLGVHAGVTTRHFPLFLRKTGDLLEASCQSKLKKLFSFSSRFVFLNQVHGDRVAALQDKARFTKKAFRYLPKTDAVITNIQGLTLLVLTADCLPLFLCTDTKPRWVGVVHAGWRGTQKEIAKKAFNLLLQKSKALPSEVQIIFGPCLGKKHYEVGGEFKAIFPKQSIQEKNKKFYFDLAGENKRQLLKAGAREKNIQSLRICTVSQNQDFYSFRKEKEAAGRMISFIEIPPKHKKHKGSVLDI